MANKLFANRRNTEGVHETKWTLLPSLIVNIRNESTVNVHNILEDMGEAIKVSLVNIAKSKFE